MAQQVRFSTFACVPNNNIIPVYTWFSWAASDDFVVPSPFTVVFKAGPNNTACVNISIVNDNDIEGDHQFAVEIVDAGEFALIGDPSVITVVIKDDEGCLLCKIV